MSGYRTNKEWLAKQAAIRQGTRDPLREDPAIDAGSEGMTEFSEQLQRDAAALRADLVDRGDITVVEPPPFPDIGCGRECGFQRRGVGLACVEGTACGAYYHPGDEHHAELEAFHAAMTGTPAPGAWHETAVILRWRDEALAGGTDRCSPGTIGELVAEIDRAIGASPMASYSGGLAGLRLPLGPAVLDLDESPDEPIEANARVDQLAVDLYMAAMAKAGSEGQRPDSVGVALACMVGLAGELLDLREVVIDPPKEVKPIAELFHAHRRELVEALGLNDADAIYLWEDLLASVRTLVKTADAAVAGLDKPEGEFFGPWALRTAEARVGRLRGYEAQLERAFGGDRWMTYADPIGALADAKPGLVARLMSGATERAIADRITPANLELLARGLAPLEPQGWREGFLAAGEVFGRELLELAKAADAAAARWGDAVAGSSTLLHLPISGMTSKDLERVRAQLDTQGLLVVEDAEDLELTERPGWRIGDRYVGRDGVGVAVDVILGESGEQIGIYGCEGTDRLVYEYGPDDACCSPLSELRSLKASPIVRSLAAAWLSGKPVMMTQIASLSRWVFERGAAGPELLGEALRMTTAKAEELITFSGWAAS